MKNPSKNLITKSMSVICICLFLTTGIKAQINWLSNFDAAKALAKKSNKLIVMDFWASWCGPCVTMDNDLWNSSDMKEVTKKFVGLRINVDYDKWTPSLYNVSVIPKVVIITASGELIWAKEGYQSSVDYLPVLKAMPENIGELNLKSLAPTDKKKDLQAFYSAGIEFQRIGITIKNSELKNSFLVCSGKYFSKAQNICKDPLMDEEISLYAVLNDVYMGKHQKALKQIEKMDMDPKSENSAELRHFILAKCYKNAGDEDNFQKEKQKILNKELIAQLEN